MHLEDWTPEEQAMLTPMGQRAQLGQRAQRDVSEFLDRIMRAPCPAPSLLGHREPCYCAEEPEFREVQFWGRP